MEKVLITGANGLLGQELVKQLLAKNYFVIGVSKGAMRFTVDSPLFKYYPVDITDDFYLHDLMFEEKPEIVVHTAAMTQVDECETKEDACLEINYHGTMNVLVGAEMHSSFIIHVSTDFVFDGVKGMYAEEDERNPVNWYGHCKLLAENLMEDAEIPSAIVRTCLVYGGKTEGGRDNIITWVKEKLEAGEKIKVVDDQWRTPTYIGDLAKGIMRIAEKKAPGIFHISGKDLLTPYQMAIETARYLKLDETLIEKVNADTFTQSAKRPAKTGFVIDKAIRELNYEPLSFIDGIKKTLG